MPTFRFASASSLRLHGLMTLGASLIACLAFVVGGCSNGDQSGTGTTSSTTSGGGGGQGGSGPGGGAAGGGNSGGGGGSKDLTLPPSTQPKVKRPDGPVVYVDAKNGKPAGDGSKANPFNTLVAGVAAVTMSGGTVVTHDGHYQGPIVVKDAKPILIQAAAGEAPVLSCAQPIKDWEHSSGSIYSATPPFAVAQVFAGGTFLQRARFPEKGFLTTSGNAADKYTVPISMSDASSLGPVTTHTIVTVRIIDYWFNSGVVQNIDSMAGNIHTQPTPATLGFECDPQCSFSYPPMAGWGYYLENETWMMKAANGWAYDPDANKVYVRLPNDADPAHSDVEVADASTCLQIVGSSGFQLQGLRITESGGSAISNDHLSPAVRLNAIVVDNIKRRGVDLGALPIIVDSSTFTELGSDALRGFPASDPNTGPNAFIIESSKFIDIGTPIGQRFVAGTIDAIAQNVVGQVKNNYLSHLSYVGLSPPENTTIEGNTVEDFCLTNDDCGGIHISDKQPGQTLKNNIVRHATANLEGKGRHAYPVAGIYLDDFSENMTVEGNSVSDTDLGLMLHNAHDNKLTDNRFFDVHVYAIRAQEDSVLKRYDFGMQGFEEVDPPMPAMANNIFESNVFVDTVGNAIFFHSTNQGSDLPRAVGAFSGSGNSFWNLFAPVVVQSTAGNFHFDDLAAKGFDSAPKRAQKAVFDRWKVTASGAKAFATTAADIDKFTLYASSGTPTTSVITCPKPSDSGSCLKVVGSADAPYTQVSTPSFTIKEGKYYLVKAQMAASADATWLSILVGLNAMPYGSLDSLGQVLTSEVDSTPWTTFQFFFKASASVSNARVAFSLPPGTTLTIGDVDIQTVSVEAVAASHHFQGFVDIDYSSALVATCPFSGSLCQGWRDENAQSKDFPITVPARGTSVRWHP